MHRTGIFINKNCYPIFYNNEVIFFTDLLLHSGIFAYLAFYYSGNIQQICSDLKIERDELYAKLFKIFGKDYILEFLHLIETTDGQKDFLYNKETIGIKVSASVIHIRDFTINDMFLELITKNNCQPYEFNYIRSHSNRHSYLSTFKNYLHFDEEKHNFNEINKLKDKYNSISDDFIMYVDDYMKDYPKIIQNIKFEKITKINRNLALVFLCGTTSLEKIGSSSLHLNGMMSPQVRAMNTGFIDILNNEQNYDTEILELFNFLREHNELYRNIENVNSIGTELFTMQLKDKMKSACAIHITEESENPVSFKDDNIIVKILDKKNKTFIDLPFEIALASLFPLLFPYGPLKCIPGKTLREKTKILLLSHDRFRIGSLGSQLILFLFDLITKQENNYYINHIKPKQFIDLPKGGDRAVPVSKFVRSNDPSFSTYWGIQQAEISAFCENFGGPDLMITLTYGVDWFENRDFLKYLKDNYPEYKTLPINFCGIETMYIWKNHLENFTKLRFKSFLNLACISAVEHYTIRLEFQGRGAPHAHILLWLKKRLSIEEIRCHFFAEQPYTCMEILNKMVTKYMIHNCVKERCFTGKDATVCKYGFPKPICNETKFVDGKLIYKRQSKDNRVVEYCPALLLLWKAHAHVHILRAEENDTSDVFDAIHYVLKYNMKAEPNMTLMVDSSDISTNILFKGRVVSLEEATARIFSFSFCSKDIQCKFIDISLPEKRRANFEGYDQKTYDSVTAYYNRPKKLENYDILQFYSDFDIKYFNSNNKQKIKEEDRSITKHLEFYVVKRKEKAVITYRNYDYLKETDEFLFQYRMIQTNYRSDSEILGDEKGSISDLILQKYDIPSVILSDPGVFAYINFLLKNNRYHIDDVSSRIIALIQNGINMDLVKKYVLLCRKKSFIDDEDEYPLPNDPLNYFYINQRVKNVIMAIDGFKLSIDSENKNIDSLQISAEKQKKYINSNFTEQEMKEALDLYNNNYKLLNEEQKDIIDNLISDFPSRKSCFISGKAGTGKSFLIETFKQYLISKNIPFCVCASTGIASIIVGGKTLHSAFQIFNSDNNFYSSLNIKSERGIAMANMEILFIDEVSMISYQIFNVISQKLKEIRSQVKKNYKLLAMPFGGIMLILTGDLGQVPVVNPNAKDDIDVFKTLFNNMENFDQFSIYCLKKNMRQGENEETFIKMLDILRNKKDDTVIPDWCTNIMKERFVEATPGDYKQILDFVGEKDMVIFYKNSSCEIYNDEISKYLTKKKRLELKYLTGTVFKTSKNSFYSNFSNPSRQIGNEIDIKQYRSCLSKRTSRSLVPYSIPVFIGARVMLLKNKNLDDGLVNGRRGTIISFEQSAVRIRWDAVSSFKEIESDIIKEKVDQVMFSNGKKIEFYQFPIKLAYAVTAHKAQGQTLEKCAICISESAFAHGALYVAFSRVKTLNNLILFGDEFPDNGPSSHMNTFIANYLIEIQNTAN